MKRPRYGQNINLTVRALGINGEGIGYWQGYPLFVDRALPDEVIRARVTHQGPRSGRGGLQQVITPSPFRVTPPCPYFERCGGCQLMHLDYAQQLVMKQRRVADALMRFGKIDDVPIRECLPSPQPLHYRNKMQLPVVEGRVGLYAQRSQELVEIDHCLVHCSIGENLYTAVRQRLSQLPPETLAALRTLLIKSAVNSGQLLLMFITQGEVPEGLGELARELRQSFPELKGVLHNRNDRTDNVVLGEAFTLLAGSDTIEEQLAGLRFRLSAASFFQVNTPQAEQIYTKAIEWADIQKDHRALDAFCGVGTLSLLMARHAREVVGVECVPQAISDAEQNAALNGLSNVRFVCDLAENAISNLPPFDVALLNPPRKGCEPVLLDALLAHPPKRIIYLSCDPATLARDLAHLKRGGYRIDEIQPFDMFPQTAHVECLARLTK